MERHGEKELETILALIAQTVLTIIVALQLLMMARAIMSWVVPDEDNKIYSFVIAVTEPVIAPVRMLIERFELFRSVPIDVSFIITYIILLIIQYLLPDIRL